ncbi:peptidylprolyl isomerase [candidate division KSB1 bacterium]
MRKLSLLPVVLLISAFCSNGIELEGDIIAKVGNRNITIPDVIQRIDNAAKTGVGQVKSLEQKKMVLSVLINEKILAQVSEKQELFKLSLFTKKMNSVSKRILTDVVLKNRVRNLVQITEDDIREAYLRMNEERYVAFIRFSNEKESENYKKMLDNGVSFEDLFKKKYSKEIESESDLLRISWNKLEKNLEDLIYNLDEGSVLRAVQTKNGIFMIKLFRVFKKNEADFNELEKHKTYLGYLVRTRLEKLKYNELIKIYLKENNLSINRNSLSEMGKGLQMLLKPGKSNENSFFSVGQSLTRSEYDSVMTGLKESLNIVLARYKNNQWSIGKFISELYYGSYPVNRTSIRDFSSSILSAVENLIAEEILAVDGVKNGYDKIAGVQQILELWNDYYLSNLLISKLKFEDKIAIERIPEIINSYKKDYLIVIDYEKLDKIKVPEKQADIRNLPVTMYRTPPFPDLLN